MLHGLHGVQGLLLGPWHGPRLLPKRAVRGAGEGAPRVAAEVRERVARADAALHEAVGEDAARRASVSLRADSVRGVLVDVRGVPYEGARAALSKLAKAFPAR